MLEKTCEGHTLCRERLSSRGLVGEDKLIRLDTQVGVLVTRARLIHRTAQSDSGQRDGRRTPDAGEPGQCERNEGYKVQDAQNMRLGFCRCGQRRSC